MPPYPPPSLPPAAADAPPPLAPPATSPPVCWEPASSDDDNEDDNEDNEDGDDDSDDHWCGTTHPGQAGYDQESGAALAELYGGNWKYDANNGWRFCGLSLEECQTACVQMGECAELLYTSNGCCFPATQQCNGDQRTNDEKYDVVDCVSPSAPEATENSCWRVADDGGWCSEHPGQVGYDESSGSELAAVYGGDWALDAAGWRYCGLTLGECMAACTAMDDGCAELYVAPEGCCYPAVATCEGSARLQFASIPAIANVKYYQVDCFQDDGACQLVEDDVSKQEYKQVEFSGGCATLATGVSEIGEQGFEQAEFDSIKLPHTVGAIGEQAFKQINKGDREAVFVWQCDPLTGTWPIIEDTISLGEGYLEDTLATFEFSCGPVEYGVVSVAAVAVNSTVVDTSEPVHGSLAQSTLSRWREGTANATDSSGTSEMPQLHGTLAHSALSRWRARDGRSRLRHG